MTPSSTRRRQRAAARGDPPLAGDHHLAARARTACPAPAGTEERRSGPPAALEQQARLHDRSTTRAWAIRRAPADIYDWGWDDGLPSLFINATSLIPGPAPWSYSEPGIWNSYQGPARTPGAIDVGLPVPGLFWGKVALSYTASRPGRSTPIPANPAGGTGPRSSGTATTSTSRPARPGGDGSDTGDDCTTSRDPGHRRLPLPPEPRRLVLHLSTSGVRGRAGASSTAVAAGLADRIEQALGNHRPRTSRATWSRTPCSGRTAPSRRRGTLDLLVDNNSLLAAGNYGQVANMGTCTQAVLRHRRLGV